MQEIFNKDKICYLSERDFVEYWKEYLLKDENKKDTLELYVHFPWCINVCKFCVFGKYRFHEYKRIIKRYEYSLIRFINLMNEFGVLNIKTPNRIYFGGGTASLWSNEALSTFRNIIPNWENINERITEIHPLDLTDEKVDFYGEVMSMNKVSIGIQSFNEDCCRGQNRAFIPRESLMKQVHRLQSHGIYVNADLICLFNGDDEKDWDIFKEDIRIAVEDVGFDSLIVAPNYHSYDFYDASIRFREIIRETLDRYPHLKINTDIALLDDFDEIIKFGTSPYIISKKDSEIINQGIPNQNQDNYDSTCIGIGGFGYASGISRNKDINSLLSTYLEIDDEFVFKYIPDVQKSTVYDYKKYEDDLHTHKIKIGYHTINPPRKYQKET